MGSGLSSKRGGSPWIQMTGRKACKGWGWPRVSSAGCSSCSLKTTGPSGNPTNSPIKATQTRTRCCSSLNAPADVERGVMQAKLIQLQATTLARFFAPSVNPQARGRR
ncbi:hypothetical protein BJ138DRAFT_1130194 [Hygrophoropsis aurantiaca]|uniref:Uncharacterized protein n=1 Tax=Hygrophoropsis aurantiaca TaxID=72124 RepID=A0ACB7ZXL8_9AGAM|nr:hypothetical protein BJ138DRAFT_1130194 [Hygrophoropsis aurantiaca]